MVSDRLPAAGDCRISDCGEPLGLALMGFDKHRARRKGARRVRERTLFLSALLGGSLGACLGMWCFRHKTKHWYFVLGMPLILAAQTALGLWLYFSF